MSNFTWPYMEYIGDPLTATEVTKLDYKNSAV